MVLLVSASDEIWPEGEVVVTAEPEPNSRLGVAPIAACIKMQFCFGYRGYSLITTGRRFTVRPVAVKTHLNFGKVHLEFANFLRHCLCKFHRRALWDARSMGQKPAASDGQ